MKVKPSGFERKKFCSRKCKGAYQSKNPVSFQHLSRKEKVLCSYCKSTLIRKKCEIDKQKNFFCNKECNAHYKREIEKPGPKRDRIPLKCEECEEVFEVINSRKNAKYCSKSCLGKANGKRAKQKLSKKITVKCAHCEQPIIKKPSNIKKINFCTVDCMATYYTEKKLFTGEKSGTWRGGKITYYGANWLAQRRAARKRDEFICQKCGIPEMEYGQELSVHHIIPFSVFDDYMEANKLNNLVSVCEPCHRVIHSGDNHPSKFNQTFG
ncbi:HNH endonuclease [Bacillus sp. Hm123]|uniref:HNH endonuclease n=1 Tax=Bacillus sp. Hm123 TaxID=3450745 RepID=UPI003F42D02A